MLISHYIISNFRKSQARPQQIDWDGKNILNNLMADFDIGKEMDKKYLAEVITDVLAEMDDKYQEVLILKYLEDKDYREISDILKKPMGTIATLLSRAKKQFKQVAQEKQINL